MSDWWEQVEMTRWRQIVAMAMCMALVSARPSAALAQGFDDLPPVVAGVIAKIGVLVDGVLGFLVAGNTLTDPKGEDVVAALGQVVVNFVNFFASLVTLF